MLSFVPDGEQRRWRTVTRSRQQLVRDRVRRHHQVEALLKECCGTIPARRWQEIENALVS
jgi:hypothetical protein